MTDKHEHLDEGTIHAWLDGALPPDESARVEGQAATCTDCAALVAEARGLIAASSRILSSLDAVPAGVMPGSDARVDQLAALRARRGATTHRWWRDQRIVAAASLLFVAGAASVVWRSSTNQSSALITEQNVEAPHATFDSASPGSSSVRSVPAAVVSEPGARDAKAEARAPLPAPTPVRVTATRAADSTAERIIAGAGASLARDFARAANEARLSDSVVVGRNRQSVDSLSVTPRLAQAPPASENQVRQQDAPAAAQRLERARADVQRPAAPPAAFSASARLGPTATTGFDAPMAAAASAAGACYRVRLGPPNDRQVIADTVRLLAEMIPVRSDPSWFQARSIGAVPDTMLMWRSVDSVTVELRSKNPADSLAMQFSTTGRPVPEVRREAGVRSVVAVRVGCP